MSDTRAVEHCAARVRDLLAQAEQIIVNELSDEPGGWVRADLLPDIDWLHDVASAADPRSLGGDHVG